MRKKLFLKNRIFVLLVMVLMIGSAIVPVSAGTSFETGLGAHVKNYNSNPTNEYGEELVISTGLRIGNIDNNGKILTSNGYLPFLLMVQAQSDPALDKDVESKFLGVLVSYTKYQTLIDKVRIELSGSRPDGSIPGYDIDGVSGSQLAITDYDQSSSNLNNAMVWLYNKAVDFASGKVPYGLGSVVKYVVDATSSSKASIGTSGNTAYWEYNYGVILGASLAHERFGMNVDFFPFLGEADGTYSLHLKISVTTIIQVITWSIGSQTAVFTLSGQTFTYNYYITLERGSTSPPPPPPPPTPCKTICPI